LGFCFVGFLSSLGFCLRWGSVFVGFRAAGREYWVQCEKNRKHKWKTPELDADLVRSLIPLNGRLVRALWAPLTSVVVQSVWYDPRDPHAEPDNDIVARMRELSYQIIIRLAKVSRIVSSSQTIGTHPQILVLKSTSTPRADVQWPAFKFYGSDLSHLQDDSFRVHSLQEEAAREMTALKDYVDQERLRAEAEHNEAANETEDGVEGTDEDTTAMEPPNEAPSAAADAQDSTQITESDADPQEVEPEKDPQDVIIRPLGTYFYMQLTHSSWAKFATYAKKKKKGGPGLVNHQLELILSVRILDATDSTRERFDHTRQGVSHVALLRAEGVNVDSKRTLTVESLTAAEFIEDGASQTPKFRPAYIAAIYHGIMLQMYRQMLRYTFAELSSFEWSLCKCSGL
jgi:hypothetical protein